MKVRKVKIVREVKEEWKPPIDREPPFHPLPLCCWVPPHLKHELPYKDNICEQKQCPCKAALKYAFTTTKLLEN